ncbi:MAG: PEGA domain-containing protein [Deltaproteobacteria bacterium]|nr:PEGA domain-containing protein [Deltaproteobacteria bacterium]
MTSPRRRDRGRHFFASLTLLAAWLLGMPMAGEWIRTAGAKDEPPPKPKVACFALPTDEFSQKAAAVLNHVARENFERSDKFETVDVRSLIFASDSDNRLKLVEKAHGMLKAGKEEYDNLELDAALEKLQKAKEMYQKAAGRLGDGADYVETLLFIGAAFILSGDEEQGRMAFNEVAMFDKRRTLSAKTFPPSMIEIFNSVKEQVAASPVGQVLVKSNPPAAEVYLNGVFKGITPVTLAKVPEGRHFVRIEQDGFLPWGQTVDFFATHEESVEATLKVSGGRGEYQAKTKSVLGDLEADPPAFALVKLGEWTGANRLVMLKVTQRKNEISVAAVMIGLNPRKKLSYRTETFDITNSTFLARADAFVSSLYGKVKIPPAGGVAVGKKDPKESGGVIVTKRCNSNSDCAVGEMCTEEGVCVPYTPPKEQWYEKWWVWAIVGGGVAVATTVGVVTWYVLQPKRGAIEFTF